MTNRVVVTAIGGYCCVGNNAQEIYRSIINGETGIGPISLFDSSGLLTNYDAEIKEDLVFRTRDMKENSRMECIIEKLIDEMLIDSTLTKKDFEKEYERCILSMATSVGTNTQIIEYVDEKKIGEYNPQRLSFFPEYIFSKINEKLGILGSFYVNTSACSAGTTAIGTAFSKIRNGSADMAVVLGADPMTEFSIYGFNSMKNMSPSVCKPFDQNNDGINIGEGGAILLLESYEHAKARNAKIYCEVYGYGLGNDAYHKTSPDPTGLGALRTMQMALDDAGVNAEFVDYINMHGTGTKQNDSMELKAAEMLFSEKVEKTIVSSTKSATGHCLAAAGTIEAMFCALAVQSNIAYGNISIKNKQNSKKLAILGRESIVHNIRFALSTSFAFAGNSSAVLLGKEREKLVEVFA